MSACLRIDFKDGLAAAGPGIIFFIPFEAGNEKQQQLGESHKDFQPAVGSALAADGHGYGSQIFSSTCQANHKKHDLFNLPIDTDRFRRICLRAVLFFT